MTIKERDKFLAALAEQFLIYAPARSGDDLVVAIVPNIEAIDWAREIPKNSWKKALVPVKEKLLARENSVWQGADSESAAVACVGVNVLDLKAMTLLDQVFSGDVNYQKRRRQMLIVGYSAGLAEDYKKFKVMSHDFQENILEHLAFDIFFLTKKSGQLEVYSGSEKGQAVLEQLGIKNYKNIAFAGPIQEKGQDKKMLAGKAAVEKSFDHPLWQKLNKICLACGKCSLVCPTCFCFDLRDKSDVENSGRDREWASCFYNDFSRVAGGAKPINSVRKKIFFWYTHKFVRIPHEYGMPGCVNCGRCTKVCPVGISIGKNMEELSK